MDRFAFSPDDVEAAAHTIDGAVLRTPLVEAPRLSAMTGARVFVKYENLQATNSFKERGAVNRLAALSDSERQRGVVTLSAGNHAQALAYHSARLGIPATIVMPETTPFTKVANTEALGAHVLLQGETITECAAKVEEERQTHGLTLVHPYDDPLVMAGQGTIALEMLADRPDLDSLIVPIGGGGLISGITIAAKALKPGIEIVGVQTALFPSMPAAMTGRPPRCGGDTLAEGIAVKAVSQHAVAILNHHGIDVVLVDEAAIEQAIYDYLVGLKTIAEGAGAAGLAALLTEPNRFRDRRVGLVLTGGNIDPRLLSAIAVRALEREHRVVTFRVMLRDRPGELGRIAAIIGKEGANILDVFHHRLLLDVPAMGATATITVETRDAAHAERIQSELIRQGMKTDRVDPVMQPGG